MNQKLKLGQLFTTQELDALTAGGQDFIRTKNNLVKGLALKTSLNPDAPSIVVVGKGDRRQKRAKLLVDSEQPVPTFVKIEVNRWEFRGNYLATDFRKDSSTIKRFGSTRKPGSVAGILFLESPSGDKFAAKREQTRIRNGGFPDAKTRKLIEVAAVNFVKKDYEKMGYEVADHQALNRGYDLLATKSRRQLKLEVKGTTSENPRFFLSRNERRCSRIHDDWRLVVVTRARTKPQSRTFTAAAMERFFNFSALTWECTLPVK